MQLDAVEQVALVQLLAKHLDAAGVDRPTEADTARNRDEALAQIAPGGRASRSSRRAGTDRR